MMRPRFYKVLSDLWSNRVRSLLVVASIAVGLFAIGIIIKLRVVLIDDMRNGYAAVAPANIQVLTGLFDDELVDRIRRVDGVEEASGTYTIDLRVKTGPDEWSNIGLTALKEFEPQKINQMQLEQGRWPKNDEEIAIDRFKLPEIGVGLGDWVEIELRNGSTRRLQLVGVLHDQTIGSNNIGGGFFLSPVQGYILLETLPELGQPEGYNRLLATVAGNKGDEDHVELVGEEVREAVEETGRPIYNTISRTSYEHPNVTFVIAIAGVLVVLGLFIVFLSGSLVSNTLSALLTQQVQQIGIMKTLGARRYQVVTIYMAVITVYGLLAALVAVPLSSSVSDTLLEFLSLQLNFVLLGYRAVPAAVITQVVLALVVPQVAGFFPIFQGTRVSVQEAISGNRQADHAAHKPRQNRRTSLRRRIKWLARPVILSLRNTFRHPWRLVLTILTLSLGGAVFIATFSVRASLDDYIAKIGNYFLADVNLTTARSYRIDRMQAELSKVPGVGRVEGWAQTRAEIVHADDSLGESLSLVGAPPESTLIKPIILKGRWIVAEDGAAIVLSELFLSRFPGIDVGDAFRLQVGERETNFTIVGFFQLAGKSGGLLAYTPYDNLTGLLHEPAQASSFRIVADQPGINADGQDALGRRIEQHLKDHGFSVAEITTGDYLSGAAAQGLTVLTIFLLFMAFLTALVGSIGLAGSLSMNVIERTREIGVLRSIGASNWALARMVMIEGMLIGVFSWALGSLLAIPMSRLMADTINLALFDARSDFDMTAEGFIVWLVVVMLLSAAASLLPARSATRLTIREVLAYE